MRCTEFKAFEIKAHRNLCVVCSNMRHQTAATRLVAVDKFGIGLLAELRVRGVELVGGLRRATRVRGCCQRGWKDINRKVYR